MYQKILNKQLSVPLILWLSAFLLTGCFDQKESKKVHFQLLYQNVAVSCESRFTHAITDSEKSVKIGSWQYQQLQFFIHNVEVKTSENGWQAWSMVTNSNQTSNVALIGEVCNEKSEQSYWQVELEPLDKTVAYTDIRFTLGVPFELNHLNPLTQPSPLNDSSMFWGWQGGHKFMRAELFSDNDDWLFHLGSTGCKALSPVRAPKNECLYPNRMLVSLPFTKQNKTIGFDLEMLIRDVELTRKNSCQSAIDEDSCKVLFKNLDMNTNKSGISRMFKAQKND